MGLALYRGAVDGTSDTPSDTLPITLPPRGQLLAHDLDGDGRAELLIWGPGQSRGTLVRYR